MLEFIPKRRLYFVLFCFLAFMIACLVFVFLPHGDNTQGQKQITNTPSICGGHWNIVTDALDAKNTNSNASLTSSVALSAKNAWVVGSYTKSSSDVTEQSPLIEHWDGVSWKQIDIANKDNKNGILHAMAAISTDDIWAVGEIQNYINSPLVEHWDGKQWNVVPTPALAENNASNATFRGVTAIAADDVWAVGSYSNVKSGPQAPNQAGVTTDTNPPDTNQNATSSKTLIEHWDGNKWNIVPSLDEGTTTNILQGITALSSNDIWAVGTQDNLPLTIHWNGKVWQHVSNASLPRTPSSSGFNAIARVPGTPYLWAVGSFREAVSLSANEQYQTLVEYWDGHQWNFVPNITSAQAGDTLNAIAAISSNDVWAIGQDHNNLPLVERWNGQDWQTSAIALPEQTPMGSLSALTVVSEHNLWSVGKASQSSSINVAPQTLIQHYC